jgi:hypothetical protein
VQVVAFELAGQFVDVRPGIGSVAKGVKFIPSVDEYSPCRRMKA